MLIRFRFSSNLFFRGSDARERGRVYITKCRQFLDLDSVSLTTVQACILLGAAAVAEGDSAVESVYYAAACRIAQLLDLPNRTEVTPLDKEIDLRGLFPFPPLSKRRYKILKHEHSLVDTLLN
jgi:hypothetical protein